MIRRLKYDFCNIYQKMYKIYENISEYGEGASTANLAFEFEKLKENCVQVKISGLPRPEPTRLVSPKKAISKLKKTSGSSESGISIGINDTYNKKEVFTTQVL